MESKRSYLEDSFYKKAILRAEKKGHRKPDKVVVHLTVPFDCLEAFLIRFYEEPVKKFTHNNNFVCKSDLFAYLLWLWGTKSDVNLSGDIFEQWNKDSTRVFKPNKRLGETRGRKPQKALISLFDAPPVSAVPEDGKEQKKEE